MDKFWRRTTYCIITLGLMGVEGILTKGSDGAASNEVTAKNKADPIDVQGSHSHSHSVYGGFGEDNLGDGFGGSGLGSYGGGDFGGLGGYGGEQHHHHHHEPEHHHQHHDHHDHHDHHKALAIKGLLVPLAGVALLGAAAAFVSNPILLQLGVISGTYGRRRRDTERHEDLDQSAARLDVQNKLNEIHILERFMAQVPKDQMFSQEKKLMANYLSCSGMGPEDACLERVACELQGPVAEKMPQETNVINIVVNEIFNNDLVPHKTKQRISEAIRLGREEGKCSQYHCKDLETFISQNKH